MAEKKSTAEVPTIKEHIRESWDMMVGSLKNLIFLWLTTIAALFVLGMIMVAVGAGTLLSAGGFSSFSNPAALMSMILSPAGVVLGLVSFISFMAYVLFMSGISAAVMLTLKNYKEKPEFKDLLSKGMKLAVPVFVLGLVVGLITLGGMVLLIIPGIIMAIFLSFSIYEKVFHNATLMDSFKGSYTLVKNNFGLIFVRWLVVVGFYFLFFGIVPEVLGAVSEGLKGLYGMVTSLGGILVNWLVLAYFLVLHREVRERTNMAKLENITWMWLVSGIGWLIILLLSITMYSQLPKIFEAFQQSANQNNDVLYENFPPLNETTDTGEFDFNADVDTEGLTPEQQQAAEEAQQAMDAYFKQMEEAAKSAE